MENYIILIHSALVVLLVLYLIIRLFISLFGLTDVEYQNIMRYKFRKPDWFFFLLIAVTGLYPVIVLGSIELYHIIKIVLLGLIIWLTRINKTMNFAGVTLLVMVMVSYSGYASFTDSPKFPREKGTFAQDHPEIINMTELEQGKVIFTTLCTQCHGENGKLGRFQAADLTLSKLTLDQKMDIINNGSSLTVMRSFSEELSPSEIEAVAKFVHEFSKENTKKSSIR